MEVERTQLTVQTTNGGTMTVEAALRRHDKYPEFIDLTIDQVLYRDTWMAWHRFQQYYSTLAEEVRTQVFGQLSILEPKTSRKNPVA